MQENEILSKMWTVMAMKTLWKTYEALAKTILQKLLQSRKLEQLSFAKGHSIIFALKKILTDIKRSGSWISNIWYHIVSVSHRLFLLNLIAAFLAIVFALDIGVRVETLRQT